MTEAPVPLADQIAVVRRTIGNSEIAVKHYPDDTGYRKDVVILRAVLASLSDFADANERIARLEGALETAARFHGIDIDVLCEQRVAAALAGKGETG